MVRPLPYLPLRLFRVNSIVFSPGNRKQTLTTAEPKGDTVVKITGNNALGKKGIFKYSQPLSALYAGIPLMDRTILKTNRLSPFDLEKLIPTEWNTSFYQTLVSSESTEIAFQRNNSVASETPTLNDYKTIYDFFMNHYGDNLPAKSKPKGLWSRDVDTDPRLSENERWNDDKVFAQTRLMGVNPVQIERVTENNSIGIHWSSLRRSLNSSFDWDAAVHAALGHRFPIKKVKMSDSYTS